MGGASPLIFVYVVEVMPPKYRGKMTALLSSFFMVGQIVVAGNIYFMLLYALQEENWSRNKHI